jgi:hypothetical protein
MLALEQQKDSWNFEHDSFTLMFSGVSTLNQYMKLLKAATALTQ